MLFAPGSPLAGENEQPLMLGVGSLTNEYILLPREPIKILVPLPSPTSDTAAGD